MDIAQLILEYLKVFIWPAVVAFGVLTFRGELRTLLGRLREADLPGGVSLDFPEQIREAQVLSAQVSAVASTRPDQKAEKIPANQVNKRLADLDLKPSPSGLDLQYYRAIAERDPSLALAGLRIELETMLKNLAKGMTVPYHDSEPIAVLSRRLLDVGSIDPTQYQLLMKVLDLCNAAVHGAAIGFDDANAVIDTAVVLRKDFVKWLSWGFPDGWTPSAA